MPAVENFNSLVTPLQRILLGILNHLDFALQ